ncbi:MAG TPA: tetratricopeptide repeat protein [Pyrinomonadaceae bacterium]|jgi:tetratricopeptide (TPR) repeat protein|nr:tetratricopeptide repeat protein [Pyrinomonadaceae bacterium]
MPNLHKLPKLGILCLLLLVTFATATAQDDPERQKAFQLYKEAKFTEALPLFEKLATAHPDDREIAELHAILVSTQAVYLKDPEARKKARIRGRELLLRAQKLGADSPLLNALLDGITPDGDIGFSAKKEVDEVMREGENAFAKGDFPKAIEMYQQALLLDPNLYEAALFIGDVYFKSADQQKAGEWFARAIQINPDRETAYRYWGDSLMKQGKVTEAGDKFVEAFIAEPYNRLARAGFVQWGERVNISLAHPRVEFPANVKPQNEKETTITLDPDLLKKNDKSASSVAWVTYSLVRANWVSGEFAKQYPNEKTYRHSLKEEAAAIRAALKVLDEQKGGAANVDQSLQILKKLEKDGLLEAFILLAMPDAGIANDFDGYRKTNVAELRRYVKQYVLTGGGQ